MKSKIDAVFTFIPVLDICKIIVEDSAKIYTDLDSRDLLMVTIKNAMESITSESRFSYQQKRDFIKKELKIYKYDIQKDLESYNIKYDDNGELSDESANVVFQLVYIQKLERHLDELRRMFDQNKVKEVNEYVQDMLERNGDETWKCLNIHVLDYITVKNDFFMLTRDNQKAIMKSVYYKICKDGADADRVWEKFIMDYFEFVFFLPLYDMLIYFYMH